MNATSPDLPDEPDRRRMSRRGMAVALLGPLLVLMVPLIAMQFTEEVQWDLADFVLAYVLLAGMGLALLFATTRSRNRAYWLGAGVALLGSFLMVWANLAVGIIGNEESPANVLFFAVPVIGTIGSVLVHGAAKGMVRVLGVMATVQALVPMMALVFWRDDFAPGVTHVLVLNGCLVLAFVVAGMLFGRAAREEGSKRG